MSEFNVRTNAHAFIKALTAASHSCVEVQLPGIKALGSKALAELKLIGSDAPEDAVPTGCAVFVVSADIVVMLDVSAGLTDVDAEIKKLHTKLQKTHGVVDKQQELMSRENFEEKASEVVRDVERKKLADAEATAENYKRTIEQFEKMKVSNAE